MATNGKIIITGPGRSGTTFLVQLLTRLGLETGFTPYDEPVNEELRAGLEYTLDVSLENDSHETICQSIAEAPRVLKGPEWSLLLKDLLDRELIDIEQVFLPVRDLDDAARSRLSVGLDWLAMPLGAYEERVQDQASVKAMALGRAIEACIMRGIACKVMHFPLFVLNEGHCYESIGQYARNRDQHVKEWTQLNHEWKMRQI